MAAKRVPANVSETGDETTIGLLPRGSSCAAETRCQSIGPFSAACKESDEIGFLYLDNCTVVVASSSKTPEVTTGVWHTVDVERQHVVSSSGSISKVSKSHDTDGESPTCTRCNLVLQIAGTRTNTSSKREGAGTADGLPENMYLTISDDTPRFDGAIGNAVCKPSSCCSPHGCNRRSDASLLTGLALMCQDYGHVKVRNIGILLYKQAHDMKLATDEPSCASYRAALVISVAIPSLMMPINPERDQPRSARQKRRSAPTKMLPPCTQLLFSIVRSDWVHLFKQMDEARLFQVDYQKHQNMFPASMSLEELYLRLQGSASHAHKSIPFDSSKTLTSNQDESSGKFSLKAVPEDIFWTNVTPYLKAKSLDSLRCTCLHFHRILRSAVPGLKLRLYRHQIKSLDWMRRREVRVLEEKDILKHASDDCPDICVEGEADLHRAISGGASVKLEVRPGSELQFSQGKTRVIRIDPRYGNAGKISQIEEAGVSRKVARGGLLCDDPGLGKTITVLSLVLQTFGLTTTTKSTSSKAGNDRTSKDRINDEIFYAYWKEQVTSCFRKPELNKLIVYLARQCPDDSWYFSFPVDPIKHDLPNYADVVHHPICFKDISERIQKDEYGTDFDRFCEDVKLCFSNATLYYPSDNPISLAAGRLSTKFEELVAEFKERNVQSAKRSFSSAVSKPNSSVALILERRSKQRLIESLVQSSATLLVVPGVLLNHWQEQLSLYMDTAYLTSKIPIVFHFGRDTRDGMSAVDVMHFSQMKTHCPLIFIDHSPAKPLPRPEFLAMFSIVITTNQRLSNEWKHGSFSDELKQADGDALGTILSNPETACPLLKVRWLRLVVDEGHAMGRGTNNNSIRFASWIEAERRWAMTGTPTPQTVSQSGLNNLRGLMVFLQHELFSARLDGDKIWQLSIARGWKDGQLASFFRLKSLLLLLMVRHTKDDIEELSPPNFHHKLSRMSQEEITAYNTLVCAIQSNLITTAMEGKTSGKQDSLLHRGQLKHARTAFSNLRLACAGGTRVIPTVTRKHWDETLSLLTRHGVTGIKLQLVGNFLHRAVTEQLSGCMCCGLQLSTLMVLPCGDLICTECMDSQTRCCPLCDEQFDVDEFQLLQPGIEYTWKFNLDEEKEKEKLKQFAQTNDAMEQASDSDTETAAPGYGEVLMHDDVSGPVAIQPAPVPTRRTRRRGDGHVCEYHRAATDGTCRLCLEEHDECVMLNKGSMCSVCFRTPEPCPVEESKFHYVTKKLEQLVLGQKVQQASGAASRLVGEAVIAETIRPVKVIIFSQFRPILNLAGHRLIRRFGRACIAEYWGYLRKQELAKFVKSRDCFCMLLGKDGSEGLDLSFVTHIFFLDKCWDKSLEDQVIARAYRMGAKGHVEVETLVSKHSVEQSMLEIEESLSNSQPQGGVSEQAGDVDGVESLTSLAGAAKEYQRAKLHFLLKNLKIIKGGNFRVDVERKRKVESLKMDGTANDYSSDRIKKVRFAAG